MWIDVIVEETRKAHEEHAAKFNYDLEVIYADLKKQEQQNGRSVISLPPKPVVEPTKAQKVEHRGGYTHKKPRNKYPGLQVAERTEVK
jgi:hypothetical protein